MAVIASGQSAGFTSRRATARHDRWEFPRWRTDSFRRRSGYEPVFLDESHGFRPRRSCHTALNLIKKTWTGCKWLIEVDVRGFFDNIDHDVLLTLLKKRIDDDRFIGLIEGMLKAGYMEDWVLGRTYSGTPQGGVVSPLLANIYLHELDQHMQKMKAGFDKGRDRRAFPPYPALQRPVLLLH